jgi:type II secretory pathway component HofQ
LLGDIPLLGWLFKAKSTNDERNEMLIFVTPRIVTQENSY